MRYLKYELAAYLIFFGMIACYNYNINALQPEIIRTKDGSYLC